MNTQLKINTNNNYTLEKMIFPHTEILVPRVKPDALPNILLSLKSFALEFYSSKTNEDLCRLIDQLAQYWLDPKSPLRLKTLELMCVTTGLSPKNIGLGLDFAFKSIQKNKLTLPEQTIITHILAGIIPALCIFNFVLGTLSRSANIIKCASVEPFFPFLLKESIEEIDPEWANTLFVSWWKGSDREIEDIIFQASDAICAFGQDETIFKIQNKLSPGKLVPYGECISFGVLLKGARDLESLARQAAIDICIYDQLGCLSPHVIYVEGNSSTWIKALKAALTQIDLPLGKIGPEVTAKIQSFRGMIEAREASVGSPICHSSTPTLEWTLIEDNDPHFIYSPLNRVIWIKPLKDLHDLPKHLESIKLQALGYGGDIHRLKTLLPDLQALGLNRVCPFGKMQAPPITWHHDGKNYLANKGLWIDIET